MLESLARVISLHHSHDRYRSRFLEKAVYSVVPTMSAIASRACRLENLSQAKNPSKDFSQMKNLVKYLHWVFQGLACSYLDQRFSEGKRRLELNDAVRDVLHTFSAHADCMHFKVAPCPDTVFLPCAYPLHVKTNHILLNVVLLHLLDNAFKACTTASKLRVGIYRLRARAAFYLEDDGCGIPETDLPRVGEMFFQSRYETSGVARGMGIGLSAVAHIVLSDLGGGLLIETKTAGQRKSLVRDFETGRIQYPRFPKLRYTTGTRVTVTLPLREET